LKRTRKDNNVEQSDADSVKVYIIEDHEIMRQTLSKVIARLPGFSLCGSAASAEAALEQIPTVNPQFVMVDVSLPDMDGIELIAILHKRYPDILLLSVSGHDESVYAVSAIQAGAGGYVMKGDMVKLVEAIRAVSDGGTYTSDKVGLALEQLDSGES
jgi:DNA-binding NarL/FixJ family response regulator